MQRKSDDDDTVVETGFCFILWPNRANALQAVSCIDRCGRLDQWLDTPGLSYIYKVGKMIPAGHFTSDPEYKSWSNDHNEIDKCQLILVIHLCVLSMFWLLWESKVLIAQSGALMS